MSATPRTDALLASIPGYENDEDWPHIAIDPVMGLCRELERELAAQVVYVEQLADAAMLCIVRVRKGLDTLPEPYKYLAPWKELTALAEVLAAKPAALAKNPAPSPAMTSEISAAAEGETRAGEAGSLPVIEIVTTPFNPGGRPCAACGAPVWLPTTRYQPAVFIFNDRVWHGYCAPKSGESLGVGDGS